MRIRFAADAIAAVREKRAWWEEHRKGAPHLVVEELAAVVAKLRTGADAERQRYRAHGPQTVWRLLMPKTRLHVYYYIDATRGIVQIVAVWNATAGAPPRL